MDMNNSSVDYSGMGGRRRKMKGGYRSNSAGGLAMNASPISGVMNAKAQNWVGYGGRSRRRHKKTKKHRHTKSCRHRRR